MKNCRWPEDGGSGVWHLGYGQKKLEASKLEHPSRRAGQAPSAAFAWVEGDLAKKHEITKRTHFKNARIA